MSNAGDEECGADRPLPVLRALIDAIDHELLQLLARRNGLVAEIALYKREHRLPVRDLEREQSLLADRCDRAQPLGLSVELIESLFRLVLWGSRNRQAAFRAELPVDVEPRTVAIIGANGGMGRLLCGMFADLGHAVMPADLDTKLTPTEAASLADVVVISVPIDATNGVIAELGPRVREAALLMDVTSIKAAPIAAMLEHSRASVVGTHPLFGPSVHSLQGQRIALVSARGDAWFAWVRQMFRARGLVIKETTAEAHDRAMAIVQVLVHHATEVMGRTLQRVNVPLDETLAFMSPVYLLELLMTARHFGQDPDLYRAIQMSNPQTREMTCAFRDAADELDGILASGDSDAFRRVFEDVHAYFGDFTDQALDQSSFLIDRLVERS